MKRFAIFLISLYQKYVALVLKQLFGAGFGCRFSPSCSEYAKRVILEYGIVRGGYLAIKRILSCQPYSKAYGRFL